MQLRFQGPVTGLLLYAAYVTAVCPCARTLSCHQREFYGVVGLAVALVVYENMQ
jgi:hypothetical protein